MHSIDWERNKCDRVNVRFSVPKKIHYSHHCIYCQRWGNGYAKMHSWWFYSQMMHVLGSIKCPNDHHRTSRAWSIVTTLRIQSITWSGVIKKLNKNKCHVYELLRRKTTKLATFFQRDFFLHSYIMYWVIPVLIQVEERWGEGGRRRFSPKINLENSPPDTNQIRKYKWMAYTKDNEFPESNRSELECFDFRGIRICCWKCDKMSFDHGLMTNGYDSCISSIGPLLIHTYDNYGEAPIPAMPKQKTKPE